MKRFEVRYRRVLCGDYADSVTVGGKGRKRDDTYEIQLLVNIVCCGGMAEAWGDKVVYFGEYDALLNRETAVNIYRCHPYPEGAVWESVPIEWCPFCGVPIAVIEKEVVALRRQTTTVPAKEEIQYVQGPVAVE